MSTNLILSNLADWLKNPVIEVCVTDSKKVKELETQLASLKAEYKRLEMLYANEVQMSIRYLDKLKEHGLSV